ncbi:Uncharacterised protein [Staphylococcus intermedius NCTC 11048]|uniref:Uncharacterized protein n=1 Tax=Staphylococcus intermedius NCTC 11048 TaxID=1141106 RepID=A0A380G4V5_STAIN|nr:Uncharacterised protein [Staphylococcus intermedius NCTC 11048]
MIQNTNTELNFYEFSSPYIGGSIRLTLYSLEPFKEYSGSRPLMSGSLLDLYGFNKYRAKWFGFSSPYVGVSIRLDKNYKYINEIAQVLVPLCRGLH